MTIWAIIKEYANSDLETLTFGPIDDTMRV